MPMICAGWERLTDRFRLLGGDVLFRDGGRDGQWSQGVVSCGGIEINLQGVRLSGGPGPEPSFPNPGLFDWSISLDKGQLAGRRALVTLWGVSLSGALAESPHVEVDPEASPMPRGAEALALRVHWAWPERTWDVTIDLLSTRPLREQPQRRAQSGS
jgi:hypothetical protein